MGSLWNQGGECEYSWAHPRKAIFTTVCAQLRCCVHPRDDEDEDGIKGVEDEDGEHEMCDCPQDCNQVTYSYSVTSTALQEDRICHKGTEKVTRKKGSFLA